MRAPQKFAFDRYTVGTCYYPEHWDESLWASDLTRMLEAGITVIRIGEFAWSVIEPREGVFSFDFFDRFLALCEEKGMKVIFGTPSATPPAWLTETHPEVLNRTKEGVTLRHGGRRHYNYNSAVYRSYVSRIVREEAAHFGPHPAIIGWQIDNELNCETNEFYSEADDEAFRVFVQKKYGTLDALNAAWGTAFWSETYTDWSQVHVLQPVLNRGNNPHRHLDYLRFVSDSAERFAAMQAEILRQYVKPGDFITTNGMFGNLDNHRMTDESLDIYMFDSYPDFGFALDRTGNDPTDLRDRNSSYKLTATRSVCPHFGIMEQQSGGNGWTTRMEAPAPRPGQLLLWAMQSVAHGADFISFFRWRTACFGTEIYWHGILDYDSRDNRKLAEVKDFARKFASINELCGADVTAAFAELRDYDNEWDGQVDIWHGRMQEHSRWGTFLTSQHERLPYDIVYLWKGTEAADLAKYPVLVMPHAMIAKESWIPVLKEYVENGGVLVLGCRSGLKEDHGQMVMAPQPGLFAELTGTDVRDFTYTSPAEPPVTADLSGTRIAMPVYNDVLTALPGTEVLARYENAYYAGEAAVTKRALGKGFVIHVGACFDEGNLPAILKAAGAKSPFEGIVTAAKDVELVMREKDGRRYVFALNYGAKPVAVRFEVPATSLLEGAEVDGGTVLPAYGVGVYALGE